MARRTFKEFLVLKEGATPGGNEDWNVAKARAERKLPRPFIPPPSLRPIIRAFEHSKKLSLRTDTAGKEITPFNGQKSLYLVGGPVRDFIKGEDIKDMDLATDATPEEVAIILSAAGFKRGGDSAGSDKNSKQLELPPSVINADGLRVKIGENASPDDKYVWFIKGRDSSKERKPFVIGVRVKGHNAGEPDTEFDIATLRRDAKTTNGKSEVEFTHSPLEDAKRRDLTINAMYIPLKSADGGNNTFYDPTEKGLYHLQNGIVKAVGNAKERLEEDPIRLLRAIRFTTKHGKGGIDPEFKDASKHFQDIEKRIAPNRIREEFIKGLTDKKINLKKYIQHYKDLGMIQKVFPGLKVENIADIPEDFAGRDDKILVLAWLLHANSPQSVRRSLQTEVESAPGARGETKKSMGWTNQEVNAIVHLLELKEFGPENVHEFLRRRAGTGLNATQIEKWAKLMDGTRGTNRIRSADDVKKYAGYRPTASWADLENGPHDVCPTCHGHEAWRDNCSHCKGSGKLPTQHRGSAVSQLEVERFKRKR